MKRRVLALVLAVILLTAAVVAVCFSDRVQLKWAINRYQNALDGELPVDLTLTIYYLPHYIFTRTPLSVEDLMEMDDTVKIVVQSKELENHVSVLKRLDASAVLPAGEEHGCNARLYYVFRTGDSVILEVWMQQFVGDTEAFAAFANGIPVEKNPVLYQILIPFLSEEDCEEIGIPYVTEDGSGQNDLRE